jgi:cyanoexosortase A
MANTPPNRSSQSQLLDRCLCQLGTCYSAGKKLISQVSGWLIIAVALMALLQMMALGRDDIASPLPLTFWLVWGSILVLLWRRQHDVEILIQQNLSGWNRGLEIFLSTIYLTALSIREAFSPSDVIGNLFPIMAVVGLVTLTVGVKQWGNFRQELSLAGVGSIPYAWLSNLREQMRVWDAQNMTFWLHYFGFKVVRQGSTVALPGGAVDVNWGCSSMSPIITMLALVLILLALFPVRRSKQIFILSTSLILVFAINGVRLILLALLVHWQNKTAFDYWHGDVGASIFSNIIVVVVGVWCYWQLCYWQSQVKPTQANLQDSRPQKLSPRDQKGEKQ